MTFPVNQIDRPPTPPTPDPTNELEAQNIDLNDILAQNPNDVKTQQENVDERMKCICKCAIL